jgi:hypothetical protein
MDNVYGASDTQRLNTGGGTMYFWRAIGMAVILGSIAAGVYFLAEYLCNEDEEERAFDGE